MRHPEDFLYYLALAHSAHNAGCQQEDEDDEEADEELTEEKQTYDVIQNKTQQLSRINEERAGENRRQLLKEHFTQRSKWYRPMVAKK